MPNVLRGSTRPVHLRRVRPKRRVLAPMGTPRQDRKKQVLAICGEWVSPCEAVRVDKSPADRLAFVTCDACARLASKASIARAA